MMEDQAEHIKQQLEELRAGLQTLPGQFARLKRDADRQIDALCEEAGIMGEVEAVRNTLESNQKKIQTQADFIQGKIQGLEEIFHQYHYAPIPEGVTHMYGIELEPLDPETRLRVMGGNPETPGWLETIGVLGGDPDRKDWDGTEDIEEPVDVVVSPTRLVPPSPSYVEDYEEEDDEEDDDTGDPFFLDEDTGDHDPNLEAIRNLMGNERS